MKNLKIYSIGERRPKDGEEIFLWGEIHSFGDVYLNPQFTKVEYTLVEIDKDGYQTGLQLVYNEGEEIPEGFEVMLIDNTGFELKDQELYSIPDDIVKMMTEKEKNED